jgi:hypothetical protein
MSLRFVNPLGNYLYFTGLIKTFTYYMRALVGSAPLIFQKKGLVWNFSFSGRSWVELDDRRAVLECCVRFWWNIDNEIGNISVIWKSFIFRIALGPILKKPNENEWEWIDEKLAFCNRCSWQLFPEVVCIHLSPIPVGIGVEILFKTARLFNLDWG